ncbi:hypothetical protein EXIGLDRAFT_828619 [Exidia glandulosa HHB12029]|uniref:Uncharacterized protein n=1 Tax=Exidia glandulosa HHB12029 TaxID=1314781 RepID=A0A165Q8V6_EXIGL|nr:hypothetical protein EXIGLDRAFT_828619 [Exidia glandulosa HHB12029]
MRLPLDIVNAVLEAAYFHQGRPDYKTLSTCALVCKDWAAHAQRLHFRLLRVRSLECATLLTARIFEPDTPRARALRNCVRVLEVGLAVELDFAADALARCAFVYELRLETVQDDVPPRLFTQLATTSSIRTLRLQAAGSRPLRQLVRALPGLTRVEASVQRWDLPDGDSEWPPHLVTTTTIIGEDGEEIVEERGGGGALRELRLDAETMTLDSRASFEVLVHAACSGPMLEALSLISGEFFPPLASYLDSLVGLRSLGLDRWNDALAQAACELPALRELQLWKPAVVRTSDALFDTLPRKLVHLSIPGGDAFTADRLTMEVGAIPRLRARVPGLTVLTVYATGMSALGPWARMLVAFSKNLDIRCQLRSEKEMMYETDLIPCTSFPRYREAANYSYMAPVALLPPSVEDLVSTLPNHPMHPREMDDILLPANTDASPDDLPAPPSLSPVPLPAIDEEPVEADPQVEETPVRTKSKSSSVRSRLRRVMHKLKVILPRPVRSRA